MITKLLHGGPPAGRDLWLGVPGTDYLRGIEQAGWAARLAIERSDRFVDNRSNGLRGRALVRERREAFNGGTQKANPGNDHLLAGYP